MIKTGWHRIVSLALGLLLLPPTSSVGYADKQPVETGNGGAVATEHTEASRAAMTILKKGGNAIDAAVAAAAVNGVTRPYSGGIGGGGIMHIYLADEDRFVVIDHRSMASENFDDQAFVRADAPLIYPESTRISSGMATAVPGAVKAWEEALKEYGTMSLKEVLQPAIEVAEKGFVVDHNFMRETNENASRFRLFDSTRKIYLDENSRAPMPGTISKNPDLAKTYRLIAKHGSNIFYRGKIARAIVETINQPPVVEKPDFASVDKQWDPSFGVLEGKLTMNDMRNYRTMKREPTKVNYRGYDVYGVPPTSSGGTTVGEIFNILEGYDLPNMKRTKALHYYLEASRYAFADRRQYLGDPEFTNIPLQGLLSKGYAAERRQKINDERAAVGQVAFGHPWPYEKDPTKQPDPPTPEEHAFAYDFNGQDRKNWDPFKFYRLDTGAQSSPFDAEFDIVNNSGRIKINERKQGRGSAYGRAAADMEPLENSELLVRFRADQLGTDQRLRFWLQADVWRSGSSTPENGYGIEVNTKTDQLLVRRTKENDLKTLTRMDANLSHDWHWLKFRVEGEEIKVRFWDNSENEPSEWDITYELSETDKINHPLGKMLLSVTNFEEEAVNTFYIDDVTVNGIDMKQNESKNSQRHDIVDQDSIKKIEASSSEEEEESDDQSTIHQTVADSEGNIVSYTTTIVSIGGNGIVVPGYGFLLNNALFGRLPTQEEDHPNYPRPHMRSLSSMSPTIVMKDGKPVVTVGAPGSDTIITTVQQILINHLDFGMTLPKAIAAPRLTQRNNYDAKAQYEQIFLTQYPDEELPYLLAELEKMGHVFKPDERVQGIGAAAGLEFLPNGDIRAAAEPIRRGGGSAMAINIKDINKKKKENKK